MKYSAAVITVSDKGSRGERTDTAGPAVAELLRGADYDVSYDSIIPDEKDVIEAELKKAADELKVDLAVTVGGTGFSPRDVTPEATLAVAERRVPGIPEAMRAESLRITPRGCLSRAESAIRGGTLIINLPGSKKAASENLNAVLEAVGHGVEMLRSSGSADCGEPAEVPAEAPAEAPEPAPERPAEKSCPSVDAWLKEAKAAETSGRIGMYLLHNGVVRQTPRAAVRDGEEISLPVKALEFSYDAAKVEEAVRSAGDMPGISMVRVWLNAGTLSVGEDLMYVLVGGDIRPNVIDALQTLVEKIKTGCVEEKEIF